MNAFNPRVAVVAGVGPGLGASLARKCAKEGCQLGLLARSSDFLETLTNELRDLGAKVLAVSTDISEAVQVAAAFRRIGEELGPVDLLINNASAGGPFRQPFVEITPESFTPGLASGCSWRFPLLASSHSRHAEEGGRLHPFYRSDFLGSWIRHHFQQRKIRAARASSSFSERILA